MEGGKIRKLRMLSALAEARIFKSGILVTISNAFLLYIRVGSYDFKEFVMSNTIDLVVYKRQIYERVTIGSLGDIEDQKSGSAERNAP